jgi:apolipoprotein N-acyltransferase
MKYKQRILFSGLLFLLITLFVGIRMWLLNEEKQLWGYLPLFFFGFLCLTLVSFNLFRRKTELPHVRWLFLSLMSGVLFSTGFPVSHATFTVFIAFVPLLFVEKEIQLTDGIRRPIRVSIYYAYVSFVVWNVLSTWWVANTALAAGAFAIFANSALMLLPFMAFLYFKKFVGHRTAYWTLVVFWIAFEYVHLRWEITWPWLTLGNSLSQYAWLPQWYSYTGVFGGSLWILMTNVFLFKMLSRRLEVGNWHRPALFGLALFLFIPLCISVVMYMQNDDEGIAKNVLIVQPNYEPHFEKFDIPESVQTERFAELIRNKITPQTDYVLLPETSFDYVDLDKIDQHYSTARILGEISAYPNAILSMGISAHRIFEKMPLKTKNVRTSRRGDEVILWESYNSAIQLEPSYEDIQIYHKSMLVPGPEIFPYRDILFFVKPIVDQLEGTVEGLGTQENRIAFVSNHGKIAPVICYESIFGEYVTEYIHAGAQAIFIMTNDGWWDNTPGHIQHLLFGRLRAIETRKSIARSANSGISCMINQRGDIIQATNYEEAASFQTTIKLNDKVTFYTQWGDIIGRLCLFIGGFQLLYLVFGIIKRKYNIR